MAGGEREKVRDIQRAVRMEEDVVRPHREVAVRQHHLLWFGMIDRARCDGRDWRGVRREEPKAGEEKEGRTRRV